MLLFICIYINTFQIFSTFLLGTYIFWLPVVAAVLLLFHVIIASIWFHDINTRFLCYCFLVIQISMLQPILYLLQIFSGFAFFRLCSAVRLALFASVARIFLRWHVDASQPVVAPSKCVKKKIKQKKKKIKKRNKKRKKVFLRYSTSTSTSSSLLKSFISFAVSLVSCANWYVEKRAEIYYSVIKLCKIMKCK